MELYEAKELSVDGKRSLSPLMLTRAKTLYENILSRDPLSEVAKNGLNNLSLTISVLNAEYNGFNFNPINESNTCPKSRTISSDDPLDLFAREKRNKRKISLDSPFESLDSEIDSCEPDVCKKSKSSTESSFSWANNWSILFQPTELTDNSNDEEKIENNNKLNKK